MVTKAATTTNCTIMRMRLGIVTRINEIIKLENAVMMVTASPITIAGFNCEVTAKALQMPSTWTMMGLSRLRGLVNASLFCLLNNDIIVLLLKSYFCLRNSM